MSETMERHMSKSERRAAREAALHQQDQDQAQAQASASETPAVATTTLTIGDVVVELPIRFAAGHTLSENEAKVLDAAYQRQFSNNQNAAAKSRREKGEPALTAAELASLYATYEPSIGGRRAADPDKLRNEIADRAWADLIADHNADVKAGGPGVLPKSAGKPVVLPTAPRKPRNAAGAALAKYEAEMAAFEAGRQNRRDAIMSLPQYADRVARAKAAIEAERGQSGAASDNVVTIDSLI